MKTLRIVIALGAFGGAALLSWLAAGWAATAIETQTRAALSEALQAADHDWVEVRVDGLQVVLSGKAQSEKARFDALSLAGGVVDSARVIDRLDVADPDAIEPPRFSVELLRNDDGVSLIGLIPAKYDRESLVGRVNRLSETGSVADMLETADHPIPDGWPEAVAFGLGALDALPRSKISISANRVAITALAESSEVKRDIETRLRARAPEGVTLALDIAAPRPVITPFTLRFIRDGQGAHFDACAADSKESRARILDAARAAGAPENAYCTIGLGAPSPSWADAAVAAIEAVAALGQGSATISDANVSLVAEDSVPEDRFDRVVGELETKLPAVFALDAKLRKPRTGATEDADGDYSFSATLTDEGEVRLSGLMSSERLRDVVASYARSRFGMGAVQTGTRLNADLPEGWTLRVLTGIEALAELHKGELRITTESVSIEGTSGNRDSSDVISRIFAEKIGEGADYSIDVSYDETLDPVASKPTPEECVADISAALEKQQITFAPGSAEIEQEADDTLDAIAAILRECGELALEVGGHTDSQGRAEMNTALSQARAEAVIGALMARRVLVAGLTAKGYGESQPIADNDTAAGRKANRRIEFKLRRPEQEGPKERDPELEATIEFEVQEPDEDTVRPRARPTNS